MARYHRINHLFSSGGERLLAPRISHRTSILTICKAPRSIDAFERNRRHLARFSYVVVESRRHKRSCRQCGIDERRIKLIYPPAASMHYKPGQPPFKILFASSQWAANQFLSRGIFLILQVAKRLPEVQFILVWRKRHHEALCELIAAAGVQNVSVINGYVEDMGALYDSVHATVLPGLDYTSFKPAPHSALDSLGRGKPLLVTPTSSIAGHRDAKALWKSCSSRRYPASRRPFGISWPATRSSSRTATAPWKRASPEQTFSRNTSCCTRSSCRAAGRDLRLHRRCGGEAGQAGHRRARPIARIFPGSTSGLESDM